MCVRAYMRALSLAFNSFALNSHKWWQLEIGIFEPLCRARASSSLRFHNFIFFYLNSIPKMLTCTHFHPFFDEIIFIFHELPTFSKKKKYRTNPMAIWCMPPFHLNELNKKRKRKEKRRKKQLNGS